MGLDTVEIVLEVEEAFGIHIDDDNAQRIVTVGEQCDYVKAELAGNESPEAVTMANGCMTATAFYRLRRGLIETCGIARECVRPSGILDAIVVHAGRRHAWTSLEQTLRLTLPRLKRPARVVGITAAIALIAGLAIARDNAWPVPVVATLTLFSTLFVLTTPFATVLPCATVADLAWQIVALNEAALAPPAGCWNDVTVFEKVKTILIAQLGVAAAPRYNWA